MTPTAGPGGLPIAAHILPSDLAAVALIDAKTCAAAGAVSVSWWHGEVAAGRAPNPVFRAPRMTRWRAFDVAQFWAAFGDFPDPSRVEATKAQAIKASAAAKAKRANQAHQ